MVNAENNRYTEATDTTTLSFFLASSELRAVLGDKLLVLLPQGVDAVDHLLDELHLGVAKPVLVGDVVGDACLAPGLSPGAAGLQLELLAASLQVGQALRRPSREVHMDGGPHPCAQVGGARVQVSVLLRDLEILPRLLLN